MKLNPISEELEWRLFEWVEGNLTSEECAELEIIISQDANLQAHVATLKATQVRSDSSDLLDNQTKLSLKHYSIKSATAPIAKNQSLQWIWKIAAAIVVLLLSTVVYQYNQPKTNGNFAEQHLSPENNKLQKPSLQNTINGETSNLIVTETTESQVTTLRSSASIKQSFTASSSKITSVEHPLIIATTLPNNSEVKVTENSIKPQFNQAINIKNNESNSANIEEETIVMMSPTAKSNPKEFAKMAWGNVKEMMRQGKLPKIILSPVKTEENQRIPDVNFGIQMNQMSFVKTVSYNPTHN